MLLTLRASQTPASDLAAHLGLSLDRIETFDLPFGRAHVFFPEATESEGTAALVLDADPLELEPIDERLYAASPLLAQAMDRVFGALLAKPEGTGPAIPLEARIAAFPCRGGEEELRRAFEPLGYVVLAEAQPLDPAFPEWGPSRCFTVTLRSTRPVRELLTHLRDLIQVLTGQEGSGR
jgi:RNA repair, ligase-Pnkp-associating, region of Hen1